MSGKIPLRFSRARRAKGGASDIRLLAVLSLGVLAPAVLATAVHAQGLPPRTKPVITTLHAEGAQIYECKPNSANELIWQFREPVATLMRDGKTVGRHYAGPGWEITGSGSLVGKVAVQSAGETKNDIAWLKLDVVNRLGDSDFSKASSIERINTHGGVFAGPCERAGAFHAEPYSADYVFLGG